MQSETNVEAKQSFKCEPQLAEGVETADNWSKVHWQTI